MNQEDPHDLFTREYETLRNEWLNAVAQHQNAHSEVVSALALMGTRDPRLQGAHGSISREKRAIATLQEILQRMQATLDRVDQAIS